MAEIKKSELEPNDKPRALEPDRELMPSGLPGDLQNAAIGFNYLLDSYKDGEYPGDEFRELLRRAQTFDDYYRSQVRNVNGLEVRKDEVPYDEDASIAAQREAIPNQEAISRFDKKMMELRALAEAEVIDAERIERIIRKDIPSIFSGKKIKK